MRDAAALLGRDHQVRGPVVRGDAPGGRRARLPDGQRARRARRIALPADGVYAGWYERPDGAARPAAVSLGRRPTFYAGDGPRLLEAHLLDFDGDLYDEPARVAFVDLLRPQLAFDEVEDLLAQMERDVADARVVSGPPPDVGRRPVGRWTHLLSSQAGRGVLPWSGRGDRGATWPGSRLSA